MTRKRYKIDTETRDLLAIVAGLVASGLPFPYGVLYTVVSTLLSFGTLNSTEYVETISYYCDTPTPRMRYTTNYYTDSRYTKIKYTMTGDSEFVNP